MKTLAASALPLTLVRRGKVREVYAVDAEHLLLVASDRVSAFDVVMAEAIPWKGAVLTQVSVLVPAARRGRALALRHRVQRRDRRSHPGACRLA